MKILIVEDEVITQRFLEFILKTYGTCETVDNGLKAVESFTNALNSGKPFDLICLDIMMPGINGQETLKRIRQIEKDKGIAGFDCVKVIMTTALGDSDNLTTAFVEQADGYLVKPITKDKMVTLLEKTFKSEL